MSVATTAGACSLSMATPSATVLASITSNPFMDSASTTTV